MIADIITKSACAFRIIFLLASALCVISACTKEHAPASQPAPNPAPHVLTQPAKIPAPLVSIFGIVHCADGITPAPDVMVWVEGTNKPRDPLAKSISKELGTFLLDKGLTPESYTLIISDSEGRFLQTPLKVTNGAEPYMVLNLTAVDGSTKPPPSIVARARIVVFGVVTSADHGGPIAKALIKVTSSEATPGTQSEDILADTNDAGAFMLDEGLAPGTYTISGKDNLGLFARDPLVVKKDAGPYLVVQL